MNPSFVNKDFPGRGKAPCILGCECHLLDAVYKNFPVPQPKKGQWFQFLIGKCPGNTPFDFRSQGQL